MADFSRTKVANEFGETIVTSKTTYVSEGRKDILISKQQEARLFKSLRYYNWMKSFGMKTGFLNNLSNNMYGVLQTLNTVSAFVTSDSLVRSIAARYGWVVGGRAFGKIQGKVLPQGGGPFGRYMRVKGGQFSRNALGNMMNFFTTTEMEFTNVNRTQRNIMRELQQAGSIGPTWAGMALAEAITGAPDPYATQARTIMKGGRMRTTRKDAGFADGERGKKDSYLSKRTDVLQKLAQSGASAPEMTYLIKAMEEGGDPDDIMRKYNALSDDIMNTLKKHEKFNPKKTQLGTVTEYREEVRQESVPINEEYIAAYMPIYAKNNSSRQSVLMDVPVTIGYDVPSERGTGSRTMFEEDQTHSQQAKVNEVLSKALGIDLYDGEMQVFETFFGGSDIHIGPDEMKYAKDSKKTQYRKIVDKDGKFVRSEEFISGGTLKDSTGEYSEISNQIDQNNYRTVRSSSNIKEHNYIASRPDIIKGLRLIDGKILHKKNPKGGFLAYGIELYQHKGLRDIEQIEYGGPATDRNRTLKNRSDRYVYARSMFVHKAAQKAANKLGIDAKLEFSKRKADVMGTLRSRQTKAIANYNKDKNQATSKKGGYTLMVDNRVRDILKEDLRRARNPRVVDGNKVKFDDISVSENLIQAGNYNALRKGQNTIYFTDDAGNRLSYKLDRKDYPPEFKNEFQKLEEDLKANLKPISGDMPLSDEYYVSGAFAKSDARRRQTQILSNDLGRNEFGNRRQLDPTQLRRQNFRVKGGVWSEEDIISQAVAEAEEALFPEYLEELSKIQKGIEVNIVKEMRKKKAAIDANKGLKGEAKRRALNDLEYETDKLYEQAYADAADQARVKVLGNLNATHPVVKEKLDDINKQIEGVIRGSGNRTGKQFPLAPVMMKAKHKKYYEALMKGDKSLADDIFDEITSGGKIEMRAIEQSLGYKFELVGTQANGNPLYRRTSLGSRSENVIQMPSDEPSIREATVTVNGEQRVVKVRDEEARSIKNFRDLKQNTIKGNAGLNDIPGVGANINKSKSNKYGDETSKAAVRNLSRIAKGLVSGTGGNATELHSASDYLEALDQELGSSESKAMIRYYRDIRSYVKSHGGGADNFSVVNNDGGFQSLTGDSAGRGTPKLTNALTKLTTACYKDDDMFNLLHLFLAVEDDDRVVQEILAVFDPTTDYGKRATGQLTKRSGKSLGDRFGGGSRIINMGQVRALGAELASINAGSKYDIIFYVKSRLQ